MEIAGWERAHGYAANEATLLAKYANRVPERLNEWDNRHFWRVSNAEHLELSENVGMVNLSHFAIYDVSGRDAERLMEYVSSSKVARSEEHTSELQSLMRISYAVVCLKKKK